MNNQEKWDRRFLELAKHISTWSKDPSAKVGSVIVDNQKIVKGLGYNGFARGVEDTEERLKDRPTKLAMVVHAEINSILMAGPSCKDATLYVYPSFGLPPVCNECCKVAIQAGIKEIVSYFPDENDGKVKRWEDSIKISRIMCDESGVKYRGIIENNGCCWRCFKPTEKPHVTTYNLEDLCDSCLDELIDAI